ncbi:MAG TPA: alanine--glyoxylate aminotransferase family protein [Gemmatimonadaceae bacterium]
MTSLGPDDVPYLLMTPGPTRVPERVRRAGARAMLHHRTPQFSAELSEMLELIGPIFGTRQPVLPVHTTGRGALEASLCNLLSPGDAIVACCNGAFGEMWAKIAETYGIVVHRVARDWASDVEPDEIAGFLEGDRSIRAVLVAYCDTSTAVRNDIAAIGRVVSSRSAMLFVDGVSALGGMPFAFDEWGVDVAITSSQKCLMSSPGLAFAVLSERAWKATESARLPRSYWDFRPIRETLGKPRPETPGTTPVHLVLQVAEALRMIHEQGFDSVLRRHETNAAAVRHGVTRLGLELQCPTLGALSPTVTAIALPDAVNPKTLRDALRSRGILTAAAMGRFEPRGFRIGHMGDIRATDIERTLAALGDALAALPNAAGVA